MVYETYADDGGGARRWFFAYERVRTPILFADGSASVRSMSDANRGFDPSNPGGQQGARIGYAPEAWEPPTLNGAAQEFVWAHIRWTREGLLGRDFGGPEVQR
jgi:hypothetical protein